MDPTTRWISILGIAALCFGLALFVLRVPLRTILIFFAIGVPLVVLWLYADEKSKQQKRVSMISKQGCICSIVKQRMKSSDLLIWSKMEYRIQQKVGCHRYVNSGYSHNITYCGRFYSKPYFSSAKTTDIGPNTNTNTNTRTECLQQ